MKTTAWDVEDARRAGNLGGCLGATPGAGRGERRPRPVGCTCQSVRALGGAGRASAPPAATSSTPAATTAMIESGTPCDWIRMPASALPALAP